MKLESLTKRENQILEFNAFGFSDKESAYALDIAHETVKKIKSNIKTKLHLQKATELTAFYWCSKFQVDFHEKKKQVLSGVLVVSLLFTSPFMDLRRSRRRASTRTIVKTENFIKISA